MTYYKSDNLIYSVWLSQVPSVGPVLQRNLLEYFGCAGSVYSAAESELIQAPGIGPSVAGNILKSRSLDNALQIIEDCMTRSIGILTLDSESYPTRLRDIRDISPLLYYRGELIEPKLTAGIVGPRRCTQAAKSLAIDKTSELIKRGYAIVSGMALGVDAYAHTAALKAGAYTIAVLGNGLDICYPAAHMELFEAIIKKGLLISEYPPGIRATSFTFPVRNKLIAALSDEVYCIDPGRKSGSLITIDYAEKYGKENHIISCN